MGVGIGVLVEAIVGRGAGVFVDSGVALGTMVEFGLATGNRNYCRYA